MKNLKGKGLLTILLVLALFVSSASMVFADLQSFLVQAEDGRYYEYNSAELDNSYLAYQINPASPAADMYEQFLAIGGSTRVVALGDSVKGWMDFAAAQNASLAAQIAEVPFVINDFFATPAAPLYAGTVTDPIVVKPDGTTADLAAYDTALAAANAKVEADYTAASWTNLQTVKAAHVMTVANTQVEIDAAVAAIDGAVDALVFAGQADLDAAKTAAAAKVAADYTADSFAALTAALALPEATNAEVVAKTTAITAAIDALVPAVDLAAYDTALAAANAKVEADYTAASWTNLQTVKAANVMTVANTQVEIDAAVGAINAAIDALVEVADMAAYDAAVAQAEAVVEADYTAATYAALQTALTDNVVTNQDSQADVDAATAAITAAYDALVKILKVASVTAPTATTVEVTFNRVPTAEDTVTYKVANVAYTPVIEGMKATLTVAPLVDDVATAVVVNDGTADLFNGTVTFDLNQVTTITPVKTTYTAQVGNNVSVQYAVKDEDGDAVVDAHVFVRAVSSSPTTLPNIEQTVATDASGLATVTINRAEVSTDTLTAYVVERPIVASNSGVTIDWNAATTGLVNVDASTNVTLGNGTAKEYTVTAKNSDGTNYTGRINMNIAVTGLLVTDLTTERWNGTAWVAATASGTAQVNYTLVAGDNGQVKFRVYNDLAPLGTFTPTFFYDVTTMNNTLEATDPRAIGGTVTYVDQTPVISFVEKAAGNTIATAALNNDGKNQKDYTLTVTDQYGNPFRGSVDLSQLAQVDGLAGTTPLAGVSVSFSPTKNGTFAGGGSVAAGVQTLNLAIGGGDTDNDSSLDVRYVGTTAGKFTPVSLVDVANTVAPADVAHIIDANDVYVAAAEVEAQARVAANILSEDVTTGDVAVGGNKIVKFTFTDQFGTAFTPGAGNLELAVEGVNAGAIQIDAVDLSYVAADNATFGFTADASPAAVTASNLTGASNIIAVRLDNGAALDEGTLRIWIDTQDDSTFQTDELNAVSSTIKFVAGVLTDGRFNAAVAGGTAVVQNADDNTFVVSDLAGDNQVVVTYGVRDQADQALDLTTPVNVVFTVENTSTTDVVTVRSADGLTILGTVAASATGTFTVATAGAPDIAAIEIESAVANRVNVSAQVEGNVDSADTQPIVWTADVVGASQTFTGTVVAVDKTNNWFLVETALGYVLVDNYIAGAGTFAAVTTTVDANTATAAQFETNLTAGDGIVITTNATPDATFALTNN